MTGRVQIFVYKLYTFFDGCNALVLPLQRLCIKPNWKLSPFPLPVNFGSQVFFNTMYHARAQLLLTFVIVKRITN